MNSQIAKDKIQTIQTLTAAVQHPEKEKNGLKGSV